MMFGWLSRILGTPTPSSAPQPPSVASHTPAPSPIRPPSSAPSPAHYQQTNKRTPNLSPGRTIKPTHIIVHHTDGAYAGSVAWGMDPVSRVSYHCIVSQLGKRTVLALPTQRTWHAGKSSWQGRPDANSWSIGVAFEGNTYISPPSPAAILSAIEYLLPIIEDHKIPLANLLRHADVSPGRKDDCSPAAHLALLTALKRIV